MKRYTVALMIAAAVLISAPALRADDARVEKAVVQFTEPVKLLDVILKGEYTFMHDKEKMAKGEPCTYVYQGGRLVVSFHCEHVDRVKADRFVVVVSAPPGNGLPELLEFRFAGSTEGHKVPQGSRP
jgi:predicted small secreted protein